MVSVTLQLSPGSCTAGALTVQASSCLGQSPVAPSPALRAPFWPRSAAMKIKRRATKAPALGRQQARRAGRFLTV